MTTQHDLASRVFHDPGLIEETQFLDHWIRLGPTHRGWVSFVARQGQRPTILLAPDRETLIAEAHKLIQRRVKEREGDD